MAKENVACFTNKLRKIVEVKVNSWNAKIDEVKLDKTTNEHKELIKEGEHLIKNLIPS